MDRGIQDQSFLLNQSLGRVVGTNQLTPSASVTANLVEQPHTFKNAGAGAAVVYGVPAGGVRVRVQQQ